MSFPLAKDFSGFNESIAKWGCYFLQFCRLVCSTFTVQELNSIFSRCVQKGYCREDAFIVNHTKIILTALDFAKYFKKKGVNPQLIGEIEPLKKMDLFSTSGIIFCFKHPVYKTHFVSEVYDSNGLSLSHYQNSSKYTWEFHKTVNIYNCESHLITFGR